MLSCDGFEMVQEDDEDDEDDADDVDTSAVS